MIIQTRYVFNAVLQRHKRRENIAYTGSQILEQGDGFGTVP